MPTETLTPDGDVSTTDWDSTGSDYHTEIDEAIGAPDTNTNISSGTLNAVFECTISDIVGNFSMGTDIRIQAHAKLEHGDQTLAVQVEYSLDDGSTYIVAGNITGIYDSADTYTIDVSGLAFNKKKANKMQLRFTVLESV